MAVISLTACGGSGSGASATAPPTPTYRLGGFLTKAPIDNAFCEAFKVEPSGVKGTSVGTGITADGDVSFGTAIEYQGNALLECTGGTYIDEATGVILTAPMLRAVVRFTDDSVFVISALTELAVQVAGSNLNSVDNDAVATAFGMSAVDIIAITPDDLNTVITGSGDEGRYGTVLAIISQLHNNTGGDLVDLLLGIAADLADGSFSSANLQALGTAIQDLVASNVGANLNNQVINELIQGGGFILDEQVPTIAIVVDAFSVLEGDVVNITVTAEDDIAVTALSLVCIESNVSLNGNGEGSFTAPSVESPTQVTCNATANDAAGNIGVGSTVVIVQSLVTQEEAVTVFFKANTSSLTATVREILAAYSPVVIASEFGVRIEGHAIIGDVPIEEKLNASEYMQALGERRAKAVRNYLSSIGVPRDKMEVVSFGGEKPFTLGDSILAQQRNRRSEIIPLSE